MLPMTEHGPVHNTGITVLLVDNERVLACVSHMVRSFGYRVLPVSTPQAALDIAADRKQRIDLLMTEMLMPEMHGHELSRQITAIRPDIQILYTSTYSAADLECPDTGGPVRNFIRKPYSVTELQKRLVAMLPCAPHHEHMIREGGPVSELFEWTYALATNESEVDRQHRDLFKLVNHHHRAVLGHAEKEQLEDVRSTRRDLQRVIRSVDAEMAEIPGVDASERSRLVKVITDLLARSYRFNVPGTRANLNWTRRIQRSIAKLRSSRNERKRMQLVHELLAKTGRI